MATRSTKRATQTPIKTEAPVKFSDDDMIKCQSITSGQLLFVGDKTGDLYSWVDSGDTIKMAYKDLISAVRTKKPLVYKPRIIIQNKFFLEQHKDIEKLYGDIYSAEKLKQVAFKPVDELEDAVRSLLDGAKESLMNMVSGMIDDGSYDSVTKIRILDKVFGTEMVLKLMK